jgi:predicted ATPase
MKKNLVVITGGPGAGKTALLELVKLNLADEVLVLPEAASILFGGGFWRKKEAEARKCAQRAIYHVQTELEKMATGLADGKKLILCDRGTIDGLAYWPGKSSDFFRELDFNLEAEQRKYFAVIHLETPPINRGYNYQNPLRTESAAEAQKIDTKITKAWKGHPRIYRIEPEDDFYSKAGKALDILRTLLKEKRGS